MKTKPISIAFLALGIFGLLSVLLEPTASLAAPPLRFDDPCDDDVINKETCNGPQACPCSHGEEDQMADDVPAGCVESYEIEPIGHNGCCVSPQCTTTNEGCWFTINVSATEGSSCDKIGPFWKITGSSSVTLPASQGSMLTPDGWCKTTGVDKSIDCGTIPDKYLHVIVGCKGSGCSPDGEPSKYKFYVLGKWKLTCGACATIGGGGGL